MYLTGTFNGFFYETGKLLTAVLSKFFENLVPFPKNIFLCFLWMYNFHGF